jgi:hypothetical protein
MRYQVTRESGFFVIRMTPAEFADFAFEQMEGKADEPKENGEQTKGRRGRPPKDSQPVLAEEG